MENQPKVIISYCTNGLIKILKKRNPFSVKVDDELIFAVNTSNILTARNTPYQAFKKAQDEQDRFIKGRARTFDYSFYDSHKFGTKKAFREWAEENKNTVLTDYITMFEDDFKIVKEKDF